MRRHGQPALGRARQSLARISLLRLDDVALDAAAALNGTVLSSLDAIHLAGARALGDDLAEVVTYDQGMAAAARDVGLRINAPA